MVDVIEVRFRLKEYKVIEVNVKETQDYSWKTASLGYTDFFKDRRGLKNAVEMRANEHLIYPGTEYVDFAFAKKYCRVGKSRTFQDALQSVIDRLRRLLEKEFSRLLIESDIMDIIEAYVQSHGIEIDRGDDFIDDPFRRAHISFKEISDWVSQVRKRLNQ